MSEEFYTALRCLWNSRVGGRSSPLLNACAEAGSAGEARQGLINRCIEVTSPSKCYRETSVVSTEFEMRLDLVGATFSGGASSKLT